MRLSGDRGVAMGQRHAGKRGAGGSVQGARLVLRAERDEEIDVDALLADIEREWAAIDEDEKQALREVWFRPLRGYK